MIGDHAILPNEPNMISDLSILPNEPNAISVHAILPKVSHVQALSTITTMTKGGPNEWSARSNEDRGQ